MPRQQPRHPEDTPLLPIAEEVGKLIAAPRVMARFREMLRAWDAKLDGDIEEARQAFEADAEFHQNPKNEERSSLSRLLPEYYFRLSVVHDRLLPHGLRTINEESTATAYRDDTAPLSNHGEYHLSEMRVALATVKRDIRLALNGRTGLEGDADAKALRALARLLRDWGGTHGANTDEARGAAHTALNAACDNIVLLKTCRARFQSFGLSEQVMELLDNCARERKLGTDLGGMPNLWQPLTQPQQPAGASFPDELEE